MYNYYKTKSFFAGVCALEQQIYAVGGYDSVNQLPTVERYDVDTNQWNYIARMNSPRSALSVAVVNNIIYAVGEWSVVIHLQCHCPLSSIFKYPLFFPHLTQCYTLQQNFVFELNEFKPEL